MLHSILLQWLTSNIFIGTEYLLFANHFFINRANYDGSGLSVLLTLPTGGAVGVQFHYAYVLCLHLTLASTPRLALRVTTFVHIRACTFYTNNPDQCVDWPNHQVDVDWPNWASVTGNTKACVYTNTDTSYSVHRSIIQVNPSASMNMKQHDIYAFLHSK